MIQCTLSMQGGALKCLEKRPFLYTTKTGCVRGNNRVSNGWDRCRFEREGWKEYKVQWGCVYGSSEDTKLGSYTLISPHAKIFCIALRDMLPLPVWMRDTGHDASSRIIPLQINIKLNIYGRHTTTFITIM